MVARPSTTTEAASEMPVISWSTIAVRKRRNPSAKLRVTMKSAEAVRCAAPPNRSRSTSYAVKSLPRKY